MSPNPALVAHRAAEKALVAPMQRSLRQMYEGWAKTPSTKAALAELVAGDIDASEFILRLQRSMDPTPPMRSRLVLAQTTGRNTVASMYGLNPQINAESWANRYAASRIEGLQRSSLDAIRTYVSRASVEGVPVSTLKTNIQEVLLMDERYVNATINRLRPSERRTRTKASVADKANTEYVRRAARHRSEVIARTEALSAVNHGKYQALIAARVSGLLEDNARVQWITAPGECAACGALSNVEVFVGEQFSMANGAPAFPPLHPNCRCTIGVV